MISPLSEITVLALEQATTLPFLTQRLAREGMRVVRVEAPGRGDPNRHIGKPILVEDGMASYFLPNNCGKQAITLNLAAAEGRAILNALISALSVDIFAVNNRPSSYAKLGIDYETLKDIRPELIWLGITGFGPDSDEAAYDPILQARAGWMDLTGELSNAPLVFGLPMADLGAAEHAYGALMKALYRRACTGAGSRIDISMLHSAVSWMVSPIMLNALGERVIRRGNTHQYFAPVSVYPAQDGYLYIAVGNDRQWKAITGLPGFEALADPAYQRNAGRIADVDRLNRSLADCMRLLTIADLTAAFNRIGVPVAKVHAVDEVLQDPRLKDDFVRVRDGQSDLEVILPPLAEIGPAVAAPLSFPPRLGEHNQVVYGELLGMSSQRLADLRERGII